MFPCARCSLSAFRHTRLSLSLSQSSHRAAASSSATTPNQSHPPSDDLSSLGDDPLAASSGQVIVGVESKYRVIYWLVSTIYVLGVTTADDHACAATNAFGCINTFNQAVAVVVAACHGVDVTPEKMHRKYAEVYMVLDIVLREAAGSVRWLQFCHLSMEATLQSLFHLPLMVSHVSEVLTNGQLRWKHYLLRGGRHLYHSLGLLLSSQRKHLLLVMRLLLQSHRQWPQMISHRKIKHLKPLKNRPKRD